MAALERTSEGAPEAYLEAVAIRCQLRPVSHIWDSELGREITIRWSAELEQQLCAITVEMQRLGLDVDFDFAEL